MAEEKYFTGVDLDMDLDDIDDLPTFACFPTGAYMVVLAEGIVDKNINEHPAFSVPMTLKEILELHPENLEKNEATEEMEEMPKIGDIATVAFMRDNEVGAGFFKEFAKPIAKHLGTSNIRAIIDQSKGLELMVVLKREAGKKENADRRYQKFVKVAVV